MEGAVMADALDNISAITDAVRSLKQEISSLNGEINKVKSSSQATVNNVQNSLSRYSGNESLTGLAGGSMGLGSGGGGSSMGWMPGPLSGGLQIGKGAGKIALSQLAGTYMQMPDLGTTVGRASGYYGAAQMYEGTSRRGLARVSVTALKGSITGLGDDAAAAAVLSQGYSYQPGSSAYLQSMKEVGGAARALNMANPTAAAAIGGFATGTMGANLYQYGIRQFDDQGNPVSQAEIAKQLFDRMFPDKSKVTQKSVQMSLQYGLAGANLRTMGFSAEQQELLKYQFGQMAAGESGDLAKASMKGNPQRAAYKITTSETELMARGEDPMLRGFDKAAASVAKLNESLKGTPDLFFELKARLQGFLGTPAGQGFATKVVGAASGLMDIFKGGMQFIPMGGSSHTGFGASFGPKGGGAPSVSAAQSPVPGVAPTTPYGVKDSSMWRGTNNSHTGQDYPVPEGTPVQAVADGTVIDDAPGFEYGIYVQIDHGNGYQTLYGHLSSKKVVIGDVIKKGHVIGLSGSTGNVTGPHLHFEVRKGKNNPVDPSQFLNNSLIGDAGAATGTAATPATTGAATSLSAKVSRGTGSQRQWAQDLLTRLGAPASSSNVDAITTWMAHEGGHWKNSATYNPLNTKYAEPGSTTNKNGIRRYTSWDQGLEATVQTLTGNKASARGYSAIVDALKSGAPTSDILNIINNSAWVTGNVNTPRYNFGGGGGGFGAAFPSGHSAGNVVTNNVQIKISVERGTEDEAMRMAKKIKEYLDETTNRAIVGSN